MFVCVSGESPASLRLEAKMGSFAILPSMSRLVIAMINLGLVPEELVGSCRIITDGANNAHAEEDERRHEMERRWRTMPY